MSPEAYFKETGENASSLAAKIGCAATTITRPLRGQRKASADIAMDVERVTRGRVTALDFLGACLNARQKFSTDSKQPDPEPPAVDRPTQPAAMAEPAE